ncbi:BRO-like protein [Salmonella enterica]|uniref:BRO-N domain-containing protein n=1 Tax=Enterobacteriaceae TaxID=543 RepID=UPI0012C74A94|nr:Bro-N domain-containing protein [Escherichia coli]EAM7588997.1 BRO-like protein [Salmonella enterica]EAV5408465.1 BRO-like protein [Salmonella enterica]EBB2277708.1 BRO-like protein [Salmonella enterica]EHC1244577.1 BRO-like protein [Escherichia coli]EKD7432536.1 Bro-N domain-containing protein [Salmonella enterica]
MSTQIKPSVFNFESDCQVRAIIIDGAPWFVAMDVCRAIGIANHRDAVRKLDSDEKGVGSTDTLGGEQETTIISESGLYTLILRCRDAVTPGTIPYRFRKWVTGEVLPQIRKTGSYIKNAIPQEDRIKIVADQVANATALAVMQTMQIEQKNYSAPLKPNYREHIHSPEGVLGLTEHSLMMNLLRQLDADGHDVEGAVAEFAAMMSYIVGASKCLRDIQTHAQYINSMAGKF